MPYAHITGWGMAVPEPIMTNDDLSKIVDTNDAWIRERTGIRERHIAKDTDFPSTLGVAASIKALKVANVRPDGSGSHHLHYFLPGIYFSGHRLSHTRSARGNQGWCVRLVGGVHRIHFCPEHGSASDTKWFHQNCAGGRFRDFISIHRLERPQHLYIIWGWRGRFCPAS